jgi:glycosyltransferase involved in cell wall biosynthesis
MMDAADTVVAGNDFLADCALRSGARVEDVHVIPTCVEPRRYPVAPQAAADEVVELIWIGSSSTLRGLEQPVDIWKAVAAAVPGLRLRVICDRFPRDFPIPVVAVPWDEADEARQLAAGQIGVSWLPDDVWSRGKCGLKVLQYQAAGLPVVANPVGCQNEMIRPEVSGFLATGPAEWADALRRLAGDPELRRRMGLAARRGVEADYSVSAWSDAFVHSLTGRQRPSLSVSSAVRKHERPAPSAGGRSGFEPHAARGRTTTSLKLVGGPQ